jgi:alpha-D-ribose 1-methylphosphonate 5-triphosphate synthase subunit PhnH
MMARSLEGGFTDRPRQAAVAFRAVLDALARPGQLRDAGGVEPPDGMSTAAGAVLLCLADAETPLWMPERLRGGAAAEWLQFHTNAPQVTGRRQAMFAFGRWDELAPLADWAAGEAAYPDRSATLIVEVAALERGPELELSGPGIRTTARFAPLLPTSAAAALRRNAARYPLGLDFFFTAGGRVAGLPRSTRIGG